MSGAYVAKPAVVSTPDYPSGWDFDWTFPGPFPPGYTPELTLSLTAPAMMVPGSSVSDIAATLKDQVEYATQEPIAGLVWSATLSNPGAIGLKLAGAEDYVGYIEQNYSDIGDDFWGGEPTLEFDASLSDVRKTITLRVESIPFTGHPVEAEAEILVVFAVEYCDEDCSSPIEETGCLADCDNAVESSPVITYIGSFDAVDCIIADGIDYCTAAQRAAAVAAGALVTTMRLEWSDLWTEYCNAIAELEVLECELDELECQDELGEDVEDEIEAKEAEIAAQEEIRDEKLVAADAKSTEMDVQADLSMALGDTAAPPGCQYLFSAAPGTEPCTNTACDELGPTCGGRDPLRCTPSYWTVQRKLHQYWCAGGEYHGSWGTRMTGRYTISGKPYITYFPGCGGISGYSCVSSGDCTGGACDNGCNTYKEYEVQLKQYFTEITPEGETCC